MLWGCYKFENVNLSISDIVLVGDVGSIDELVILSVLELGVC